MKFAQLFILILAFFVIRPAQAGLLIEPVLGVGFSKFESKAMNKEYKANGLNYGGRLGYQNLGFQLGLDYLTGNDYVDSSDIKGSYDHTEWALFAGFEFPVMLRVYAGYIFSAQGETKTNSGTKVNFNDGSGMKVGLGFTGLPFVDLNIEYRKGTYDETKFGGVKNGKTDFNAIMVGLSVPFVI